MAETNSEQRQKILIIDDVPKSGIWRIFSTI